MTAPFWPSFRPARWVCICAPAPGPADDMKEATVSILSVLIPVTIAMGLVGLVAFVWSLRSGQYEDLTGDAARILSPDADRPLPPRTRPTEETPL